MYKRKPFEMDYHMKNALLDIIKKNAKIIGNKRKRI